MENLSLIMAPLFSSKLIIILFLGTLFGLILGVLPGLGPTTGGALILPFTMTLDPLSAIVLLTAIYCAGTYGGAITAVLINTPGTPDSAATAIDGHPLAKQGKHQKATKMALFSSVTGDTFSDLVLITVSAPLAVLALKMGPVEKFALMVCAFSIISGLVSDSIMKGLIAGTLGLLFATIGLDPEHGTPRLFFGYYELYDGLPLASVAIGMLAISEILKRLSNARGKVLPAIQIPRNQKKEDQQLSFTEYWSCRYTMLRGAIIGTVLGAMPGIGSTAAAFMSYASAKQASKDPSSFGKGNLHGVAATESANSAVMGANLIPLLTLGIPGSVSAALLISAFVIHGIQPGPLLFENQGRLIYGLFGAMIIANFANLWIGQIGLRFWSKVIQAPESIIFSSALLLCFVGVFLATGGLFGVTVMLIFGVIGYLMSMLGFSVVIFIITFFLGKKFEQLLSQTLVIIDGNPLELVNFPFAIFLFILAVLSFWWLGFRKDKDQ